MRWVLAAWLAGVAADQASTCSALERGVVELIQTQSCRANLVVNAGEGAVGVWGLSKLHKSHPKAAIALGIGMAGFRFTVAARNQRIGR